MAYTAAKMRRVEGVPGQSVYRYQTTDLLSVVVASGYFDDAVDDYNLDTGDIIMVTTGASMVAAIDVLVAINTSGTVTVVNGT